MYTSQTHSTPRYVVKTVKMMTMVKLTECSVVRIMSRSISVRHLRPRLELTTAAARSMVMRTVLSSISLTRRTPSAFSMATVSPLLLHLSSAISPVKPALETS